MTKKIAVLLLLGFFLNTSFGIETLVSDNKKGCSGLILSFLNLNSEYTTFRKLPENLPDGLLKTYPENLPKSKFLKYGRDYFATLISKEVIDDTTSSPLKKLNPKELYTFVVTDKEIRFASTSRAYLSPKNFASKHAILAKGEPVHYAGEAWFENGILVINHNSGTYRPKSDQLRDLATYFQRNFNVERVSFSDVLPEEKKIKSISEYIDDFKNFLKSRKTTVTEGIVNFFARDRYMNRHIKIGIDGKPGSDLEFEVSDFIGSGVFGVVHKLKIISMSDEARRVYAKLLDGEKFRDDLVVKLPHNLPILRFLPVEDVFNKTVIRERDVLVKIQDIVDSFGQSAADVLASGNFEGKTFLIKQFVKASSVQKLVQNSDRLSAVQMKALERDIYKMAEVVREKLGANLDIKAENVAWDEVNQKFIMYELSLKTGPSIYLNNGFEGYLKYFYGRMTYWKNSRRPASSDLYHQCPDSKFQIPDEFKKIYRSSSFNVDFDLAQGSISIPSSNYNACFYVDGVSYMGAYGQVSLKFVNRSNSKAFVIFNLVDDFLTNDDYVSFQIFNDDLILGKSMQHHLDMAK